MDRVRHESLRRERDAGDSLQRRDRDVDCHAGVCDPANLPDHVRFLRHAKYYTTLRAGRRLSRPRFSGMLTHTPLSVYAQRGMLAATVFGIAFVPALYAFFERMRPRA